MAFVVTMMVGLCSMIGVVLLPTRYVLYALLPVMVSGVVLMIMMAHDIYRNG
jgi:hypothetical protein